MQHSGMALQVALDEALLDVVLAPQQPVHGFLEGSSSACWKSSSSARQPVWIRFRGGD